MLKKFSVLLFSIFLMGTTFYGISSNSYYVQVLMNLSINFIYIRIALVAILLTYVFVPSIRFYTTRTLLYATGILLIMLGVISVGSPSLLGHANFYMLLGDSLTLIEAGIVAIVLSAELSAQRSRFMARSIYSVRSLIVSQPREIANFPAMHIVRTQKSQFKLGPVITKNLVSSNILEITTPKLQIKYNSL